MRVDTCVCGATHTVILPKLIDTVAPNVDIKINNNSIKQIGSIPANKLFFNETQTVTITAEDNGSGVDKVYYYIADKEITDLSNVNWLEYNTSFEITPNNRHIIYVKAIDKVGNEAYINSDEIVLDNIAPKVSSENGKIYCKDVLVTVTDDNLDTVTLDGNQIELKEGKVVFTVSHKEGEQTIVAKDKAGNKTESIITVNNGHTPEDDDGDCTTPVKCKYCKEIVVEAQEHDFTGKWQKDANYHWHECTHEGCTVTDTKIAHDYCIKGKEIKATYFTDGMRVDTCVCGVAHTVILPKLIDTVAPNADIKINNNSIKQIGSISANKLFFNETQTVTITAVDNESGVDKIYYYVTNKEITDLTSISWTEYNKSFVINPNNKYIIYAKVTDKVGNEIFINSKEITIAVNKGHEDNDENKLNNNDENSLSKTGDNSNLLFWLALFFAFSGAFISLGIINKRKKFSEK